MGAALPKVLIIDDEPRVRAALSRMLSPQEYLVLQADCAEDALGRLGDQDVDVVVSDIFMPGLNGVELLRHIRESDADLPVILVTGQPDLVTATEAVELRAFRYMAKPPSRDAFCDAVKQASDLRRSRSSRPPVSSGPERRERYDRAVASLRLAHQPIVDAEGNVMGREALIRPQVSELGNPLKLIGEAEHYGHMSQLGLRIQQLAAATFPAGDELLFLNVHPSELNSRTCGKDAGLRRMAHRIVLEITERASLESVSDVRHRIEELREIGFRVAVDDLGAGYSALNSVVELDPEFVKLDRQLVSGIDKSRRLRSVVKATVTMCRSMGIRIIAECVETAEELKVLRDLECDWYQGYFFGRPELV